MSSTVLRFFLAVGYVARPGRSAFCVHKYGVAMCDVLTSKVCEISASSPKLPLLTTLFR